MVVTCHCHRNTKIKIRIWLLLTVVCRAFKPELCPHNIDLREFWVISLRSICRNTAIFSFMLTMMLARTGVGCRFLLHGMFPTQKSNPHLQSLLLSLLGKILEKEMATHSIILAWKTPWREEPGGLQSMGLQKSQTLMCTHTLAKTIKHHVPLLTMISLPCIYPLLNMFSFFNTSRGQWIPLAYSLLLISKFPLFH